MKISQVVLAGVLLLSTACGGGGSGSGAGPGGPGAPSSSLDLNHPVVQWATSRAITKYNSFKNQPIPQGLYNPPSLTAVEELSYQQFIAELKALGIEDESGSVSYGYRKGLLAGLNYDIQVHSISKGNIQLNLGFPESDPVAAAHTKAIFDSFNGVYECESAYKQNRSVADVSYAILPPMRSNSVTTDIAPNCNGEPVTDKWQVVMTPMVPDRTYFKSTLNIDDASDLFEDHKTSRAAEYFELTTDQIHAKNLHIKAKYYRAQINGKVVYKMELDHARLMIHKPPVDQNGFKDFFTVGILQTRKVFITDPEQPRIVFMPHAQTYDRSFSIGTEYGNTDLNLKVANVSFTENLQTAVVSAVTPSLMDRLTLVSPSTFRDELTGAKRTFEVDKLVGKTYVFEHTYSKEGCSVVEHIHRTIQKVEPNGVEDAKVTYLESKNVVSVTHFDDNWDMSPSEFQNAEMKCETSIPNSSRTLAKIFTRNSTPTIYDDSKTFAGVVDGRTFVAKMHGGWDIEIFDLTDPLFPYETGGQSEHTIRIK